MSFFFSIVYLIVEYMRPQQMYDSLAGLPLAQIAIVFIIVALFVEGRRLYTRNFQNVLLLAYLSWFAVSSIFAHEQETAWQALRDFSKWVIIYFLLINIIKDRNKLYVFVLIFLLLNFKYAQYAVRVWAHKGFYSDPRGLNEGGGIGASFFKNPNDFGAALNSVFGISFYLFRSDLKKLCNWFRMRWLHAAAVISIPLAVLSTSSRGAALALGACAFGILFKSKKRLIGLILFAVALLAYISLIPADNWGRFQIMGTEEDKTGQERMDAWKSSVRMAQEHPATGVGPNNFYYMNQHVYRNDIEIVQHNIFLQAASELGYPGLLLFISMVIGCFFNQHKTRRLLRQKNIDDPFLYGFSHGLDISLIGFLVNGFFITVLYYPFFWMLLIFSVSLVNVASQLGEENVIPAAEPAVRSYQWTTNRMR